MSSREPHELKLPAVAHVTALASCILFPMLTVYHALLKPAVPCPSNSAPTSPLKHFRCRTPQVSLST